MKNPLVALQISENDLYSNFICKKCALELSKWKQFKNMCIESRNRYFKEGISTAKPETKNLSGFQIELVKGGAHAEFYRTDGDQEMTEDPLQSNDSLVIELYFSLVT